MLYNAMGTSVVRTVGVYSHVRPNRLHAAQPLTMGTNEKESEYAQCGKGENLLKIT
jgi:hypothetical protein